jgi:hypothetical protein
MLDDAMRRAVFDTASVLGRVAVLASNPEPYRSAVAGTTVIALDDSPFVPPADCAAIVLEGLDDVEDPGALLRAVASALPAVRLFALIANAAYAESLEAFIGGAALARGHAYVLAELAPLFAEAGWAVQSIDPIMGGEPAPTTFPIDVSVGQVKFRAADRAMLERLHVAGYVVVALPI